MRDCITICQPVAKWNNLRKKTGVDHTEEVAGKVLKQFINCWSFTISVKPPFSDKTNPRGALTSQGMLTAQCAHITRCFATPDAHRTRGAQQRTWP
jgi:hypothetical protein